MLSKLIRSIKNIYEQKNKRLILTNKNLDIFLDKFYKKSNKITSQSLLLAIPIVIIYHNFILKFLASQNSVLNYSVLIITAILLSALIKSRINLMNKASLIDQLITGYDQNLVKNQILNANIEELKNTLNLVSHNNNKELNLRKSSAFQVMQEAIKSKKELEQETKILKRSYEQINLSLEKSQIGIWSWNIEDNLITWDDATHQIFGLKPKTFLGQYENFLALVHHCDRRETDKSIKDCINNKNSVDIKIQVSQCNGDTRFVRLRANFCKLKINDKEAKKDHLVGSIIDISHDQKSFEFPEKFLSLSPNIFMILKPDGVIESIDDYSAAKLGYQSEDLISKNLLDFIANRERKSCLSYIQKSQTSHNKNIHFRNSFKTKENSYKSLEWILKADPYNERIYSYVKPKDKVKFE